MRNLYFKIFMWFWLAMALVGMAFVISTVTSQTGEAESRWRPLVAQALTASGQAAVDVYKRDGPEALATFFESTEPRYRLRAYLLDDRLVDLAGRDLPEGGRDLAAAAAASDELQVKEVESGSRLIANRLETPDGDQYVMLAEMLRGFARGGRNRGRGGGRSADRSETPGTEPGSRGGGFRDRDGIPRAPGAPAWYGVWLALVDNPGVLAYRLLAVFLTAGLVCYALARYLTAPVLRLRAATNRVAAGDLSVRVGPELGSRKDELAELGRDFDLMAGRIESLLTTQRQLLSDVSHELRSPLARLNVALALARQRSGPEAGGALDRIESEAEQLNALIGRVLALARLESGAVEAERSPIDLARLVADVADDADFEARGKGCTVTITATEPCKVLGSDLLLRSAIENVVRNAVRYTGEGTAVEIEVSRAADEALVRVRDHGPGVPEDQLGELFRPFYRLADARDRESGGTGLGLSITERAIRLHGGGVEARNAEGGGLLVELRLPLGEPMG